MEGDTTEMARSADSAASDRQPTLSCWTPLTRAVPTAWLTGFMWVGATVTNEDEAIQVYKHGITRHTLVLDHRGQAYNAITGHPTSMWEAIEYVYADIELTGHTRHTPYFDDLIAERSRTLRQAGWTVVHSAPFHYSE